jgi:heme exporter protein CcmB
MSLLANTTILLGKELRTEFRSRELLTTTIVFILIVLVLFSFTFDPLSEEARRFGSGLLWLAFLFAASLMLQPCFLREQTNKAGREHTFFAAYRTAAAARVRDDVQRAGAAGSSLAGAGIFSG